MRQKEIDILSFVEMMLIFTYLKDVHSEILMKNRFLNILIIHFLNTLITQKTTTHK